MSEASSPAPEPTNRPRALGWIILARLPKAGLKHLQRTWVQLGLIVLAIVLVAGLMWALVAQVLARIRLDFGNVPAWVSAIGTIGTLSAALYGIYRERQYRQAAEAQERDERRQAQARLIAAVSGAPNREDHYTPVQLINGSDEPVYRLVVGVVFIQGAAPRTLEQWMEFQDGQMQYSAMTTVNVLPSGHWQVRIHSDEWAVMMGRIAAEVAFTDRAGRHWVRRATGELHELATEPFEHLGLHGPYEFQVPEPISARR